MHGRANGPTHALNKITGVIEFESLLERIKWKIKYNKNMRNSIKGCCNVIDSWNVTDLVYHVRDLFSKRTNEESIVSC